MSAPATVKLKGEGGVVWEFDLPLTEVYADQVKNRMLEPADEESAAELQDLLADEEPAAEATTDDDDGAAETTTEPVVADESPKEPGDGAETDPNADRPELDLEALGKMKLTELVEEAKNHGVDQATIESFAKPGTSKASVIAAITAAHEKE